MLLTIAAKVNIQFEFPVLSKQNSKVIQWYFNYSDTAVESDSDSGPPTPQAPKKATGRRIAANVITPQKKNKRASADARAATSASAAPKPNNNRKKRVSFAAAVQDIEQDWQLLGESQAANVVDSDWSCWTSPSGIKAFFLISFLTISVVCMQISAARSPRAR